MIHKFEKRAQKVVITSETATITIDKAFCSVFSPYKVRAAEECFVFYFV